MIGKLFITAGISAAVAVAALSGAVALVSHDLGANNWTWTIVKEGHHVRFRKAATPPVLTTSKTLPWTGGDSLAVETAADVEYVPGAVASVAVTGPQAEIDRVHVENGRVFLVGRDDDQPEAVTLHWGPDGLDGESNRGRLHIVVTAPGIRSFTLSGSGDLTVHAYDQPALSLTQMGSGSVDVSGRTDSLTLNMSGSGDADLSALQARDADITVSGSGDAEIAAVNKVKVDISGSGDVNLTSRPDTVESHISGSGTLDQD